jgi:hypothetical protein
MRPAFGASLRTVWRRGGASANQHHGRRVYQLFRDELAASWIQFIPIVECAAAQTIPRPVDGACAHR